MVFVVLAVDPAIASSVMRIAGPAGRTCIVANDVHELVRAAGAAAEATDDAVVIVEGDAARKALRQRGWLAHPGRIVVEVAPHVPAEPPPGARVVVQSSALAALLEELVAPRPRVRKLEYVTAASVLFGPLDDAIGIAADQIAAGLDVERCVISLRGDSNDADIGSSDTVHSLSAMQTPDRWRPSLAAEATVIATRGTTCESTFAVRLETPRGTGFVGVSSSGARVYSSEEQRMLGAVASRLTSELRWRGLYDRTTDELDRVTSGPGLDASLGIWNRTGLAQVVSMYVAIARRSSLPLTAVILEVVDLRGINTRHGMGIGDRVLRRIADALRTILRTDDVIARWSGRRIAVVSLGNTLEGATRLVQRVQAGLAARPLELATGESLAIPTAVGIAVLQPGEDTDVFLERALATTLQAAPLAGTVTERELDPLARSSQRFDVIESTATLGGAYRLLHEISRGGMGVVYRAEDLALERPVAIKMLRPDLAEDRAFVEHLRSEAAMLARLQHPNLVQVFNFGQTGGDSYFVMELVEGEALQDAAERHEAEKTRFPIPDLVSVVEEIASALDALHERGIIHRDVKPANIIRDPFRGRSILVDVGLARRFGENVVSAGTPGYVAPEVIGGQEATARSDVYGLAATVYTMLTLSSPWGTGEVTDILTRQATEQPRPPSALRAELAPVDAILLGALHPDPAQRPRSAGAFARSLVFALAPHLPAPPADAVPKTKVVFPRRALAAANTRGVVFRSVSRAIGVRDAERLRDRIDDEHPLLARALADAAPLAWLPTALLTQLLSVAPAHVDRDAKRLARDLARASVRASFRRFFPASAATLVPERTLAAIRNVWSRYHSWGVISSMPVHGTETVVRLGDTPRDAHLCEWTVGLLETLVTLSSGPNVQVAHEQCEALGDEACMFRVVWTRPTS